MNLLPKASGSRPRLACEILPGGVVAGRSPEPGAPLSAVGRADLPVGAVTPGLKVGNIADRVAVIAAIRRALTAAGGRSNVRNGELTLVIPDAAVRVLLLDFDALPSKLSEALPIVRFRLKKLVPFDTEDAMVSFQVMSTSRAMIRVLAVTMPRDVLAEYESLAREAGFEPGAVLPSTLAALAGLQTGEGAALVVNASPVGITTAIVRAGILLLHRSIELADGPHPVPANLPAALFESSGAENGMLLPLVDRDATEAEWAAQEALPQYGRNPYADRIAAEEPTQDQDAITGANGGRVVLDDSRAGTAQEDFISRPADGIADLYAGGEAAPVTRSPYASATLQQELETQFRTAAYLGPTSLGSLESEGDESRITNEPSAPTEYDTYRETEPAVHTLAPDLQAEEIARAVSVAIAFFEDNLAAAPEVVLSAGPYGAEALQRTLQEQGIAMEAGVRTREMVDPAALAAAATSVPRSWLAGVTGALKS